MIPEWNNITQQYELPSQSLWESLNPANLNVTGDWAYPGFVLYDFFPILFPVLYIILIVGIIFIYLNFFVLGGR